MHSTKSILGDLEKLRKVFNGDILTDHSSRLQYAVDASVYREIPIAVSLPKDSQDVKNLIQFAKKHNTSLIPRAAGTSLAGQVVGNGIIVDISKYFSKIIEFNKEEKWVRVQPGVVRDELNNYLAPSGLFFSPETSTSNRCMIGGMVGNNACGLHSLVYGSTRDHIISMKVILSDRSTIEIKPLTIKEFKDKCDINTLEGDIYRNIRGVLTDPANQEEIRKEYPHRSIKRRNTGYAIDLLLETEPFSDSNEKFNFSKLIAGSEGTLAFISEIKLNLDPLPPKEKAMVCVHCNSLQDALKGNLIALKYNPVAIELMDNVVMEQSKKNIEQNKNRFFIKGDPDAMLMIEFANDSMEEIIENVRQMEKEMRDSGRGYHFHFVEGGDIPKVWDVRKAGLGLLSNIPGDAKPVPVVEDTAVRPVDLPNYIIDFKNLLSKHSLDCVYYAHISTGELHLRPVLNLKDKKDVELFHTLAFETAKLVKKYKGSLSGEHGDGRLRGEFIHLMIGDRNYNLLKQIKQTWDPYNIFNPGKIVDTQKMNTSLRYIPGQPTKEINTIFDFSSDQGYLRSVEKCNGSGDCRRSEVFGKTMCPSFQATRNEKNSTRARANILREFITNSTNENPFDHKEIYDILDLCLSCKACKSECPSGVDVAKLKAEFLQHYYNSNGFTFRVKMIANLSELNSILSIVPAISNFCISNKFTSKILKRILGFSLNRNIPKLYKTTLKAWLTNNLSKNKIYNYKGKVYFFADEFTNFNDTEIGIKAIQILTKLGYEVKIPKHTISARTYISKGLIKKAKKIAIKNVNLLNDIISVETPLIGIEPSAILTFRDEYPDLVRKELKNTAIKLGKSTLMFDEFIAKEFDKGNISPDSFTKEKKKIKLHGHCHQKSIASTEPTKNMLSLPKNYEIEEIKSGCCGMAGAFGFEKEHYDLSMKIGELVLFPEVRKSNDSTIIVAPGTSCRQQIFEGTGKIVKHPVEVIYEALIQG